MWHRLSLVSSACFLFFTCVACGSTDSTGSAPVQSETESKAPAVASAAPAPVVAPTAAPTPTPGPPAPGFDGGGIWINSKPLTLEALRGKVVLVNFWTYGCYNCQNTLPYEKVWWDKYKDKGLVIVGVHSPEFASEQKLENVQAAVKDAGIGWPVVQDNEHTIWNAYRNRYWPRFYLLDHNGRIIYDHIGEGGYDEMDNQIAAALKQAGL